MEEKKIKYYDEELFFRAENLPLDEKINLDWRKI